ncbi:MAG: YitT family protein [Verrucomicrobiota bacterium JB023]|nr:YitT family protein [Verrucomicrobiota bacterium JB023]
MRKLLDYLQIIGAGLIYACALKYFVLPSKVILTGTEGIATALSYYFESYHLFIGLYLIFQLILVSFAWVKIGRIFAARSLLVVIVVVSALTFFPEFSFAQPEPQNERIILVIFGGLLAGVAKAIAFRSRGSTGDEDILGAFFAMKFLKPVGSIAVIAACVSTSFGLGLEYLKNSNFEAVINTLMYTSIYIFVSAETLNNLYRKFKITMLAIVTKKKEKVGAAINQAFEHRTYTTQEAFGGRSGDGLWLVKTIVTQEELPHLLEVVEEVDPEGFYYHQDIEGISRRYYISPIG